MELLRTLTLIYAAVLVIALAVSLIAILVWLIRIGRALGEVKSALITVADNTRPLEQFFTPLGDGPDRAEDDLKHARAALARADERLQVVAEKLGATTAVR